MIYTEDCLKTLKRKNLQYDYVLFSPPDFDEIGLNPNTDEWDNWLNLRLQLLSPKRNLVSICVSDRKFKGTILQKHRNIIQIMKKNKWGLKSHKIWVKTLRIDIFRLTYMHILTFAKKPHKVNAIKDFTPDVLVDEKSNRYENYKFGMSLDVCKKLILNHTQPNDIVYDPFMGSGTSAIAAIETDRIYLGSEIKSHNSKLIRKRIKECISNSNSC